MKTTDDPPAGACTPTADLADIAALDRLATRLSPEAALRRYARQHRANGVRPHRRDRRLQPDQRAGTER